MLLAIYLILVILWLVGLVSSYTISGSIHNILVLAIIFLTIRLVTGKITF